MTRESTYLSLAVIAPRPDPEIAHIGLVRPPQIATARRGREDIGTLGPRRSRRECDAIA